MFWFQPNIVRSMHTTLLRLSRRPRRSNPGIALQLQTVESEEQDKEWLKYADPDDPDHLESNFANVHQSHRQHEEQVQRERDHVRHLMVKHKYFPQPKLPNLLTYAEKEQIRLLHTRDPEEWTAQRLAESFPTTPEVVKKILDAKWRPRSTQRIREHDEAVIRNWEDLRTKSDMQLPPALEDHLKKFAPRTRADLQDLPVDDWPTRLELPKPKGQEFLSIITSCDKSAEDKAATTKQQHLQVQSTGPNRSNPFTSSHGANVVVKADAEDETYIMDKVKDKRRMRLQELKQFKLSTTDLAATRADADMSTSPEQRAEDALSQPSGTGIVPRNLDLGYAEKFESNEIVISHEDRQRFEMTHTKSRIYIPRKVWRSGATYRVDDAYYDDDGEFLYSVPGMTGSRSTDR